MNNQPETVFVTGASGFVAMEIIRQLLTAGYMVRGSLRSMEKAEHLHRIFEQHVPGSRERLAFIPLDLLKDAGWEDAAQGCAHFIHTASPFPFGPSDEVKLVRTAVEGTQRALKAAVGAGIKRVVLTSSVAAVSGGHPQDKVFNESFWTDVEAPGADAYSKSKTLAEKIAWEFVANLPTGQALELVTINPCLVLGPALDAKRKFTSAILVRGLLTGAYPGLTRLSFGIVDVRDVAAAHLAAMTTPEAAGKRFIVHAETLWIKQVADILREVYQPQGYKIVRIVFPDWLTRLFALVVPDARNILPDIGRFTRYDTTQARTVLNWQPHSAKEAVLGMAQSLIEQGALKRAPGERG